MATSFVLAILVIAHFCNDFPMVVGGRSIQAQNVELAIIDNSKEGATEEFRDSPHTPFCN